MIAPAVGFFVDKQNFLPPGARTTATTSRDDVVFVELDSLNDWQLAVYEVPGTPTNAEWKEIAKRKRAEVGDDFFAGY